MKKIICIVSLLSVILTSCLKDKAPVDFSTITPIVELPYHGLEGFSSDAVLTAGQTDPITIPIIVNLASVNPLSKDIAITLSVDDAIRTAYNGRGGVQYQALPDSTYEFAVQTGTIPAGKRLDTLYLTVFPDKVDPTANYMLPIKIADASGTTISGNFGIYYIHMIGNPLAGNYDWTYNRWNTATPTGAPSTVTTGVQTGIPDDPTTIELQSGYGAQNGANIRYQLSFDDAGTGPSGLTNFSVEINPNDVTGSLQGIIGVLSYTGASIILADPVNKHFTFTYAVVNGAGSPRYFTDDYIGQ